MICPGSIRKQWSLELGEKFKLPCAIFDSRQYRLAQRDGNTRPFEPSVVVIVSANYTNRMRGPATWRLKENSCQQKVTVASGLASSFWE